MHHIHVIDFVITQNSLLDDNRFITNKKLPGYNNSISKLGKFEAQKMLQYAPIGLLKLGKNNLDR